MTAFTLKDGKFLDPETGREADPATVAKLLKQANAARPSTEALDPKLAAEIASAQIEERERVRAIVTHPRALPGGDLEKFARHLAFETTMSVAEVTKLFDGMPKAAESTLEARDSRDDQLAEFDAGAATASALRGGSIPGPDAIASMFAPFCHVCDLWSEAEECTQEMATAGGVEIIRCKWNQRSRTWPRAIMW